MLQEETTINDQMIIQLLTEKKDALPFSAGFCGQVLDSRPSLWARQLSPSSVNQLPAGHDFLRRYLRSIKSIDLCVGDSLSS